MKNFHRSEFTSAYNILCSALPSGMSRSALYPTFCKIPKGGKTQEHGHFETEIFFIIKGKGRLTLAGDARQVISGDLIHIPPFALHQLENLGEEELEFLSVYSEGEAIANLPKSVIITSAPPTPNGPLHLGHMSGPYLAQDIMARYLKIRSVSARTHSGTDDHQNYVQARAESLGIPNEKFRSTMRQRIQDGLKNFSVEMDEFIEPKTNEAYQINIQAFVQRAIQSNVLTLEKIDLPYCEPCKEFLVDSRIEGICPFCESSSRGGCENCGIVVSPHELGNPKCSKCGTNASRANTEAYTFALSDNLPLIKTELAALKLSPRLRSLVSKLQQVKNMKVLVTYPGKDGIQIGNQNIHVWLEMAAHYEQFALSTETWIHSFGFDNSFYYLLFIPALLRALNSKAKLPDFVLTNEFLTLDGKKFSTSRNHAIWADEVKNAEYLRLYLCLNRPAWKEDNFSQVAFNQFASDIERKFSLLEITQRKESDRTKECIIMCNRWTREMELFLSPANFDLRSAAQLILEILDVTLQWQRSGCEYLLQDTLGTLLAPFMPQMAKTLGQDLWQNDWSSRAAV